MPEINTASNTRTKFMQFPGRSVRGPAAGGRPCRNKQSRKAVGMMPCPARPAIVGYNYAIEAKEISGSYGLTIGLPVWPVSIWYNG